MTRLRLFLKNLARRGPLLNLIIALLFIPACQPSVQPTSFQKENIPQVISDTLKKEYNLDVKSRLAGETLWIYIPIEGLFERTKTQKKHIIRFSADKNNCRFEDNSFKLEFLINPVVPETEQLQEFELNKKVLEDLNNIWGVIRRMLFSMDRAKNKEPNFIFLTAGDVKNGIEVRQISYYSDLKKLSYGFISMEEYQHRVIQETDFLPEIIGDKEGRHLKFYDVPLAEFVAKQIKSRVDAKFLAPEVKQTADIEKEIINACSLTITIYGLRDFNEVIINNLATGDKTILNAAAIWEKTAE